jgi:hypothetical protein
MACFQTKKSQFGTISDCLAMEAVGIFYGHLVYLKAICFPPFWYIFTYPYFTRFGMLYQEKSGNPGSQVCISAVVVIVLVREDSFDDASSRCPSHE